MQQPRFTLISHALCPYVQRAAIVLREKGIAFERIDIDLVHKPDWFLQVSPLGKTPVLLADGAPVFESAVICEYLEDVVASPPLHPRDALERARHRGWMEFGSSVLNAIAAFYNAADEARLLASADDIRHKMEQVEAQLAARADEGPYFAGAAFGMVDAVFGPVFRYFDVLEAVGDFGFFRATPQVQAWRQALADRASVQAAAHPDYAALLRGFLRARPGALARRLQ